jgi:hypothetical protein
MDADVNAPAQPESARAERVDPVVLPDVASQAHPSATSGTPAAAEGQVADVARKVGGSKKLSEIADTLGK